MSMNAMLMSYRYYHAAICIFYLYVTPTTYLYTLSLHDALPILGDDMVLATEATFGPDVNTCYWTGAAWANFNTRSEEHTSELQSLTNLVCRLLLEKKKQNNGRTE